MEEELLEDSPSADKDSPSADAAEGSLRVDSQSFGGKLDTGSLKRMNKLMK